MGWIQVRAGVDPRETMLISLFLSLRQHQDPLLSKIIVVVNSIPVAALAVLAAVSKHAPFHRFAKGSVEYLLYPLGTSRLGHTEGQTELFRLVDL